MKELFLEHLLDHNKPIAESIALYWRCRRSPTPKKLPFRMKIDLPPEPLRNRLFSQRFKKVSPTAIPPLIMDFDYDMGRTDRTLKGDTLDGMKQLKNRTVWHTVRKNYSNPNTPRTTLELPLLNIRTILSKR
jgi:hypothetical protein